MASPPTDSTAAAAATADEPPFAMTGSTSPPSRYADWKAPPADGEVLIWPDPSDILRATRENHRRLFGAGDVRIGGVPLPELRRAARAWLGQSEEDRLLIATGHQTELYHPGVWAKHSLTTAAASKLGGTAIYFAVDTDSPKHLSLKWPGGSAPISDDPRLNSAAWAGLLDPPSPAHLQQIEQSFQRDAATFDCPPALPEVLHAMRRRLLELGSLSAAIVNATHELDWSLGLRYDAMLTSPLWSSEAFLVFVHHVLSRADAFAAAYNAALASFRREHNERTPTRPMPDLFAGADSIEAPFWLDDLSAGTRTRPSVFPVEGGFQLELLNGESFLFQPAHRDGGFAAARELQGWLRANQCRLSPRALTLTLFLRLMVVDQFVHGIGGGRYDQITDQIIADHFGIAPPQFAVTTATLYLPQAMQRERVCLPCIRQEGHRLKHGLLGERKREMVERIAALPRRSAERDELFTQMHEALKQAAVETGALDHFAARLRAAQVRHIEDEVLFNRELFYALQPRERLSALIDRYREAFAAAS